MKGILSTLIEWLIIAAVSGFIYYIIDKFFRIKPRIFLMTKLGGVMKYAPNGDYSDIELKRNYLVLINNSKYTAYNLRIYTSFNKTLFENTFDTEKYSNIEGHNKREFEFSIKYKLDNSFRSGKTKVIIFNEILAQREIDFRLIIEYENSKNKKFYSFYDWNNGEEISKLKIFKPKL